MEGGSAKRTMKLRIRVSPTDPVGFIRSRQGAKSRHTSPGHAPEVWFEATAIGSADVLEGSQMWSKIVTHPYSGLIARNCRPLGLSMYA